VTFGTVRNELHTVKNESSKKVVSEASRGELGSISEMRSLAMRTVEELS